MNTHPAPTYTDLIQLLTDMQRYLHRYGNDGIQECYKGRIDQALAHIEPQKGMN